MGYARIPDVEILNGGEQPGKLNKIPSAVAQQYIDLFKESPPDALRLGMGDNFAPNLFSRTFQLKGGAVYYPEDPCAPAVRRVPKDRFYYEGDKWRPVDSYASEVPTMSQRPTFMYDNVAQFFIDQKYDALVPGEHDFYFGPERLRELAHLLHDNDHPVHMLGANLTSTTSRAARVDNSFPRTPERFNTHHSRGQHFLTDFHDTSIDLPAMVFPYKQQFVVKGARQVLDRGGNPLSSDQLKILTPEEVRYKSLVTDPYVCSEKGSQDEVTKNWSSSGDPNDVPLPGASNSLCTPLVAAEAVCASSQVPHYLASTCESLYPRQIPAKPSHPSPDVTYLFDKPDRQLRPGLNHLFCAHFSASPNEWTCKPFFVQNPLLTFWNEKEGKAEYEPYIMAHNVTVFGLVDPDLLTNVGLLNTGWLNENHSYDTVTKVAPADFTLEQALESCDADEDCRTAPKVVMAQMSYAKAAQLISRFDGKFDLVISQADQDHQTGTSHITKAGAGPDAFPKFILTPEIPYHPDADEAAHLPPERFVASISTATLWRGTPTIKDTKDRTITWTLDTKVRRQPNYESETSPDCKSAASLKLADASSLTLSRLRANGTPSPYAPLKPSRSDPLRDLALMAMRMRFHTDIAILQKRDFYNAETQSNASIPYDELQNQLDRIFWKNDYLVTLHLTGATIRKIMKQSKAFDQLDEDGLATEIEKGRGLLPLGLFNDPKDSDSYYVDGVKMNDATLYSVAATQFVGAGDTGYTDLGTPDVPPGIRTEDFETLYSIAGLVCSEIVKTAPYKGQNIYCDAHSLKEDYFDQSKAIPSDKTAGFDTARHYTTFVKRLFAVPRSEHEAENVTQQRHYFALNLESMDLNYSGTYINNVKLTKSDFAGISAPGVTVAGSNSVGFDHRLRGIWDFGTGTLYFLNDSSLSRLSTTTSSVPSISSNMWGIEAGGTWRLWHIRRPSWLSFQYSGRFEGELTNPSASDIKFSVNIPPPDLFLRTPQISTVYGRAGLRAEFMDTHLEIGFEEIDSRNLLLQYVFNNLVPVYYCQPSPSVQLACGSDAQPNSSSNTMAITKSPALINDPNPIIHTADYLNAGAYLNLNFKFPLWSRKDAKGADQSVYLIVTNKGDMYFPSPADTSVQTRYLDKLSPSLNFPIYGKLSLAPRVDFILFENKVNHNVYRAVQPVISLTYSFKWPEGTDIRRALGYGAVTSTQPAASR
jgi:hypothetical protein